MGRKGCVLPHPTLSRAQWKQSHWAVKNICGSFNLAAFQDLRIKKKKAPSSSSQAAPETEVTSKEGSDPMRSWWEGGDLVRDGEAIPWGRRTAVKNLLPHLTSPGPPGASGPHKEQRGSPVRAVH
uniref:Uncharacterized protein n=1 Tax=Rousettus aegyptiacus TaxID=9407 RepID=A0A7J8GB30_ROUAE|nr:hypothetical protein HJG63_011699 [Rousettus aegyptiacus]